MFGNLIARAIIPVTIAVTGFVIFGCLFLYSFIKSDMTKEALRNLDSSASTVVKSTRFAMMEDDRKALQNIVSNISTRNDVELIRIYDHEGNLQFTGQDEPENFILEPDECLAQFQKSIAKANPDIRHRVDHAGGHMSVTLPILNEGKCSTTACHFHAETDQILGYLIIGVSSAQLEKTLALLKNRMVAFSLMVLFLTVGGVTALLRMNLFLPILRLSHNVERAVQGASGDDLSKPGRKLDGLDKNVYQLVKQRDQARSELSNRQAASDNADEGNDDSRSGNPSAGHRTAPEAGSGED